MRREAAYTDASQRLQGLRREASEAQTRAHELHVELLRLSSEAEAATTRRAQLEEELQEVDAQLEGLQERRGIGEARFEELDQQLAVTQERQAELEEAVIAAERRLAEVDAREAQALEINDNVVQGLASAAYALQLGFNDAAAAAVQGTLASARTMVENLLAGDELDGPRLVRERPAVSVDILKISGANTVAVADSVHSAVAELERCSGTQFDPQVVPALLGVVVLTEGGHVPARALVPTVA